jgi:predicted NAD/FAD-binding protein
MPKGRRFWSAWNYHAAARQEDAVAVTYWMNELQKLHSPDEHFVSLNPMQEPAEHLVDREMTYNHPVFTPETLAAQSELWDLQGHNRTWFAGAWFGAGFHEDGLQAGLAVAEQLGGVSRPWSVPEPSNRISVKPIIHMPESQIILAAE